VCWVVTEKNMKDVINFQWNCKARSRPTYKSSTLQERERERERESERMFFWFWQVFADHASSLQPIVVPRTLLWNLRRRFVFFGTSVTSIFRGMTTPEIQACFWRGMFTLLACIICRMCGLVSKHFSPVLGAGFVGVLVGQEFGRGR
jgi:hypothetical protein